MSLALETYRQGLIDAYTRHYEACPDIAAMRRLNRRIPPNETLKAQMKYDVAWTVLRRMFPSRRDAFVRLQTSTGRTREQIASVIH